MPQVANPSEEEVADFRPSGPGWRQRCKSTQSPGGTYLSRSVARFGLDCVRGAPADRRDRGVQGRMGKLRKRYSNRTVPWKVCGLF